MTLPLGNDDNNGESILTQMERRVGAEWTSLVDLLNVVLFLVPKRDTDARKANNSNIWAFAQTSDGHVTYPSPHPQVHTRDPNFGWSRKGTDHAEENVGSSLASALCKPKYTNSHSKICNSIMCQSREFPKLEARGGPYSFSRSNTATSNTSIPNQLVRWNIRQTQLPRTLPSMDMGSRLPVPVPETPVPFQAICFGSGKRLWLRMTSYASFVSMRMK